MKSKELAEKLLDCPDVEVMFQDPNSSDGPFSVSGLAIRVAKKGEYPKDFNMPKGFKFIELFN